MRWRMRIEARSRTQEISCGGLSCEVMHSEVICTMCSEAGTSLGSGAEGGRLRAPAVRAAKGVDSSWN